jgi:hypothetical protein
MELFALELPDGEASISVSECSDKCRVMVFTYDDCLAVDLSTEEIKSMISALQRFVAEKP